MAVLGRIGFLLLSRRFTLFSANFFGVMWRFLLGVLLWRATRMSLETLLRKLTRLLESISFSAELLVVNLAWFTLYEDEVSPS